MNRFEPKQCNGKRNSESFKNMKEIESDADKVKEIESDADSGKSNSFKKIKEIEGDADSMKNIEEIEGLILRRCSNNISKKNLFLWFRVCFGESVGSVVWYKIDTLNNVTDVTDLNPICTVSAAEVSMNFATAALGSDIYMVGGDYIENEGSSDVILFDTCTGVCQKQGSLMLVKRSRPTAVSTHGKIYVFGSNVGGECRVKPWGEVFDPKSKCWSPLAEPPPQIRVVGYCHFHSAVVGDRILLGYGGNLFSFDVKTNHWEIVTSTHPLISRELCGRGVAALDGNILFTYSVGTVLAYDFVLKKLLKVEGLGIESFSYIPVEYLVGGNVLRLGVNTLCVVWYDEDNNRQAYVRRVTFEVTRVNNAENSFFLAEVQGRSTYKIVNGRGKCFIDCFEL